MFQKLLGKIFNVSPEVIEFISDSKQNFKQRIIVLAPLVAWASFFGALSPLILKLIIDSLTNNWTSISYFQFNSTWPVFLVIITGLGIINLLDNLFSYFKNVLLIRLNQQTESYLEDKFNTFLTKFDGAFLSGENNLRLIRNLQFNIQETQKKMLQLGQSTIETVVGISTLIFIIPLIHPLLILLIILSVLFDSILDYFQNQSWRSFELLESRQREEKNELAWRMVWFFNKLLENGWIIQILDNYKNRRSKWMKTDFSQKYNDQVFSLFRNFSSSFLRIGTYLVAGWLFLNGQIEIGTLVIFELYITQIKNQTKSFSDIFRNLVQLRFELFRYDFLIHIQPKLDYTVTNKPEFTSINSIQIKNLTFEYPKFFAEEKDYLDKMKARITGVDDKIKHSKIVSKVNGKLEQIKQNGKNIVQHYTLTQKVANLINKIKDWIVLVISNQSLNVTLRKDLVAELDELDKLFSNSNKQKVILEKINLELTKGKIYGIVGENGAGKTTLMKLLKRSIDTTSGDILINANATNYKNTLGNNNNLNEENTSNLKTNLKTIEPLFWKNYLGSIDQNNFIWEALSVRENILLGTTKAEAEKITDKRIYEVIEKVGLSYKISNLELILGENLELSGGETQLLEIARIILQEKPIIILDEATNQLDAKKEQQVIEILQELKQNSIIIFITHRMTTTNKCDQIIVLEHGKITAIDTPQKLKLSSANNLFKQFWETQVGKL